jgi:Lar family restriction alleviation protein
MMVLDYCPFCGSSEITIKTRKHNLGIEAHAKCGHCSAQGGSFVEETKEAAVESVIQDWNQKDLRPTNICHRIKKRITQIEYDIHCYWYKIKNWDF